MTHDTQGVAADDAWINAIMGMHVGVLAMMVVPLFTLDSRFSLMDCYGIPFVAALVFGFFTGIIFGKVQQVSVRDTVALGSLCAISATAGSGIAVILFSAANLAR